MKSLTFYPLRKVRLSFFFVNTCTVMYDIDSNRLDSLLFRSHPTELPADFDLY